MSDQDFNKRLEFAVDLAERAGQLGLKFFREIDKLTIESKGHQDLVSNGDREVELFVRAEIAKAYPEDGIVGEEHAPTVGTSGHVWIIDPIDGTANFVRGIPQWCVIIACMKDGKTHTGVVHEPVNKETFYAHKGGGAFLNARPIRVASVRSIGEGSIGTGFNNRTEAENIIPVVGAIVRGGGMFFRNASGGLMLAYVAAGRLIGYTEEHMNAWDCVAAMLIVEEAGGRCEPYSREDVLAEGTVVIAGAPGVFDWIRKISFEAFALN
ncbi:MULTISPECIES: inositol monophosphatase family protein [Mesorhizobium]|uniref:Inositol-1-monophosphatase n=1 Tax=Mesorhizobium denitrificans TaxID=2294114 RepID=A0A371XF55_9HYPH|nr:MULTISPECIES: inositol monophosphatase family protein [Mesorhizobium]RFC67857.1 inositol monophosphatase [Mesorhizobium denitrificans]